MRQQLSIDYYNSLILKLFFVIDNITKLGIKNAVNYKE